jgi:hypothetical protein
MKPHISSKIQQFSTGIWKVIGRPGIFIFREEIGCDQGQSIYSVELRKDDPYDATKCIRKFDSLNEAAEAL